MTRSLSIVLGVTLCMLGIAACAQSPPQGIPPSRWSSPEFSLIRGAVVCTNCGLEEARSRYPEIDRLYEFDGTHEQVVFRVDWVNDAVRWQQITLGNRLSVRADPQVFQKLTNPEHLFRQVELNVILRDERTMDIGSVSLIG
ncbi:MAG: hypothetical protein AB7G75_26390 [Candidatus Binatia bacterium]